jgi:polyhydroxybutyrate depolymerase
LAGDCELTVGGRARTFTVRPPAAPRDGEPVPLVVVLHGNFQGGGGALMREWTSFDAQAERWGWAVAYPDGVGGCWADGRGVTTADEAGVDDVAFLRAVVDWSAERYGTAADRTVVAGISNGAFMAHRMGVQAGERVAVLAAVAGGMPAALLECRPAYAVSALLVHGVQDRLSPIEGGYSRHRGPNGEIRGRTLSLRETAERWRAIDRCPPARVRTDETELSSRETADGGAGGSRVAAWTLREHGHSWPGGATWGEPTSQEFDAAEEICRFAEPLLAPATARRL